jgi:hypothetical protein
LRGAFGNAASTAPIIPASLPRSGQPFVFVFCPGRLLQP